MNKVILMGRLTREPDVRYSQNSDGSMAVARYTLAVDRRRARTNSDGAEQTADFISCVAFRKTAEFIEKYFRQGMRMVISGRIQTGSYTNRDGQKVYTTDVVVEEVEFAESKASQERSGASAGMPTTAGTTPGGAAGLTTAKDGFMNIPDGIDEELPFN